MKNLPSLLLFFSLGFFSNGYAQAPVQDSAEAKGFTLQFEGYIELYAQHNLNGPATGVQPAFVYSHHRLNELNLNLGYAKAALAGRRFKANLGLAAGTYMNRNYETEPATLQHLWEANAAWQLHPARALWIEAGVFLSHIGFEHPASVNCLTLTRSICADNSPYYESGVKLSYANKDESWYLAALMLNGWQRIQRIPGNSSPAAGVQVTRSHQKWKWNYSNFIGNVYPDSVRRWRHFHSAYADYQTQKFELMLGFDAGWEQTQMRSRQWNHWYTTVAIGRYQWKPKWYLIGRAEYFYDPAGVAAQARPTLAFSTSAFSLGLDYAFNKKMMARAECKQYLAAKPQFEKGDAQYTRQLTNVALAVTVSL